MAQEEYFQGSDVTHYKWNTVDMEWQPVACSTSDGLSQTKNFLESKTKCDTATRRRPNGNDYSSTASLLIVKKASQQTGKYYYNDLQEAFKNDELAWYAFLSNDTPVKTVEQYFQAYVQSLNITAEDASDVTVEVEFAIDGEITNIDPFATT